MLQPQMLYQVAVLCDLHHISKQQNRQDQPQGRYTDKGMVKVLSRLYLKLITHSSKISYPGVQKSFLAYDKRKATGGVNKNKRASRRVS